MKRASIESLEAEALSTGFRVEMLEKAVRMMGVLEGVRAHPLLRDRLALKGGTALNLFVFDVPRLSVDIDLNYVGAEDREEMLKERPAVEQALEAVFGRENLLVRGKPREHAGGKWWLRYGSARGRGGTLELDVNFMHRVPLWPLLRRDSRRVGCWDARDVLMMDIHELVAGKLCALLSRRHPRDVFDSHRLLLLKGLDPAKLRTAFVVYGAMSRRDWRNVSLADVESDPVETARQLAPILRRRATMTPAEAESYGRMLEDGCRRILSGVLPLAERERAFLDLLLDVGRIDPTYLTSDRVLQQKIRHQPLLHWKAMNVRYHRGIETDEPPAPAG